MIVSGTIIAAYPMGIYTAVVDSEVSARRLVRQQYAAGYDYIKVHNVLPVDIYDAIFEESRRLGIGVVGHIPHDISVAHAVAQGQKTFEHLKGYINDRNLEINSDDWMTPTQSSTVWNVPTLYAIDPSSVDPDRLVNEITQEISAGYVFPAHQLDEIRESPDAINRQDLAKTISVLY
jgi:hypothetical protein